MLISSKIYRDLELANVYYVQASTMISHSNQTFKYEQVDAYKNLQLTLQYTDFNQLVVSTYGIWKVTLDKEECIKSTCTCPMYYKRYVCKHIIGICLNLKLFLPPIEARNVTLGKNNTFL